MKTLGLPQSIENSLTSKLEAAVAALGRGDRMAARGSVGAFINDVQAQKGKAVAAQDADGLMGIANKLLLSMT